MAPGYKGWCRGSGSASTLLDSLNCRPSLRQAQQEFPPTAAIILQKRAEMDPKLAKQVKSTVALLKPVEAATYRLSPLDNVLEKRLVLAEGALWVPAIPDSAMHIGNISWRKWLFNYAHATLMNPHRAPGESYQLLRRMGYWDTLGSDFNKWITACEACQRYRARPVQPPCAAPLLTTRCALSCLGRTRL